MRPKILDFAVSRVDNQIQFHCEYDWQLSQNTLKVNGKKEVFVTSNATTLSLVTHTRVKNEKEDRQSSLSMATKTKVNAGEKDDKLNSLSMATKTFVVNEKDD